MTKEKIEETCLRSRLYLSPHPVLSCFPFFIYIYIYIYIYKKKKKKKHDKKMDVWLLLPLIK